MADSIRLSKIQAHRFLLAHHSLLSLRQLQGKQGALDYIRHVDCIQFDTVNVVGANADLELQSRVAGYTPALLEKLLYQDRSLIDGWWWESGVDQKDEAMLSALQECLTAFGKYLEATEIRLGEAVNGDQS